MFATIGSASSSYAGTGVNTITANAGQSLVLKSGTGTNQSVLTLPVGNGPAASLTLPSAVGHTGSFEIGGSGATNTTLIVSMNGGQKSLLFKNYAGQTGQKNTFMTASYSGYEFQFLDDSLTPINTRSFTIFPSGIAGTVSDGTTYSYGTLQSSRHNTNSGGISIGSGAGLYATAFDGGDCAFTGGLTVPGVFQHGGSTLGFYNTTAITQPSVSQSNQVIETDCANLFAALVSLGLVAAAV